MADMADFHISAPPLIAFDVTCRSAGRPTGQETGLFRLRIRWGSVRPAGPGPRGSVAGGTARETLSGTAMTARTRRRRTPPGTPARTARALVKGTAGGETSGRAAPAARGAAR
ncbi:hypothetical protein SHKM778_18080 [Streptomyces sp. KM77-8]|uniref:Uncharacterized protein n=1 Tax=Streptomyces haneummycinicus TaxID=3074435 RepID=A0AAT9HDF9_9ACTN